MASRRTLYIRANNFTQQRFTPPLMKIHHEDDEDRHRNLYAVSRRGFIGSKSSNLLGFRGRSMSTMFTGEVADAAADSSYPVAAVQYMIDGVHSFTGMNWWASIAVSTILAHGMITPIMIHSYKVKRNVQVKLQRIFPMLSKLFAEITDKGHSLGADDFDRIRPQLIMTLKEFVTMQLTPFYGLFSRTFVLISFYYAIGSMAENVPSFKTGGAFLVFTDLTTPDNLYILPTLSALAYWMSAEKVKIRI